MYDFSLPNRAIFFGLAGVVPQFLCLLLVLIGGPYRWVGLTAGCFYAAIILSFLGGMWWMATLLHGRNSTKLYALAVLPSLAGWASLLPWVVGWSWPKPSLMALGFILLISPIADRMQLDLVDLPPDWLRLRILMASGLGSLTIVLSLL